MDASRKSVFRVPERHKDELVNLMPPEIHMTAYVTGGLKELFRQIHVKATPQMHDYGEFTNENGHFVPCDGMPPLGTRYKILDLLGQGQSSVIFKAQDNFSDKALVAIKILNSSHSRLGAQESACLRRLNKADPYHVSSTLHLINTFMFDSHYCMVFEILHPRLINKYFSCIPRTQKLKDVKKVSLKLLQALGFLWRQNVIHADLKPENILLKNENCLEHLKIVDFGNSIGCTHNEMSLYYDDFELQTLIYRAPEVMFGLSFGTEIDMWSLGLVLIELYAGQPLFPSGNKIEILGKMYTILGPLPRGVFQKGKFYQKHQGFTGKATQADATNNLYNWLKKISTTLVNYSFCNFIAGFLRYNPDERFTPAQASTHPFLASEVAVRYLMPLNDSDDSLTYPRCPVTTKSYRHSPCIDSGIKHCHLTSVELLHTGTNEASSSEATVLSSKKIAQISPYTVIPKMSIKPELITSSPFCKDTYSPNTELMSVMEAIHQEQQTLEQEDSEVINMISPVAMTTSIEDVQDHCHENNDNLRKVENSLAEKSSHVNDTCNRKRKSSDDSSVGGHQYDNTESSGTCTNTSILNTETEAEPSTPAGTPVRIRIDNTSLAVLEASIERRKHVSQSLGKAQRIPRTPLSSHCLFQNDADSVAPRTDTDNTDDGHHGDDDSDDDDSDDDDSDDDDSNCVNDSPVDLNIS